MNRTTFYESMVWINWWRAHASFQNHHIVKIDCRRAFWNSQLYRWTDSVEKISFEFVYWVKWRAITLTNKQVSTRLFKKGKLQKRSLKQIGKQSKNNSVWKDRWTNLSTNYLAWLPQLHKITTNEVQSKRKGELNNSKLSRQRIWIQNSNLPQKTERHVFDTLLCLALKVKKSLGQIELCCIKAKNTLQLGNAKRANWLVS